MHVISYKTASERFSFHFREVLEKMYRIYRKILNSDEGDFKILVKSVMFYITETSPYSFGNFRKLSLYNCFMPILLIIRFKCYNTVYSQPGIICTMLRNSF